MVMLSGPEWECFAGLILPELELSEFISPPLKTVGRKGKERWRITVNPDTADRIFEICTNRFVEVGLKPDSEPNSIGLCLEDLADLFNTAS